MGPQGDVITSTWRARKGWRSFQVTDPLEGSGGVEGYFQHIPLSHWAQNIAEKRAALLGVETGSRWGGGQSHAPAPMGVTLAQGQGLRHSL